VSSLPAGRHPRLCSTAGLSAWGCCGDDEGVPPNLAEIPADGDADAEEILGLARDGVTAELLGCLVDRDRIALGRYGARHVTAALRQSSARLLRDALLAMAIGQVISTSGDDRDVMVGLAVYYFAAGQLGQSPADLFGEVAARLPDGWVPDLLREFGARQDITPDAFGWLLIQTPDGPDFTPAPPPYARHRDELSN
jgi:hypothetical protein